MGCYDYITVDIPCPLCGKIHNDWQTKDVENCFLNYEPGSYVDDRARYITGITDCVHRVVEVEGSKECVTVVAWLDVKVYLDEEGCIPKENIDFEVTPEIKHRTSYASCYLEGETSDEFNAKMKKMEEVMNVDAETMVLIDDEIQEGIWWLACKNDPDVRIANELHWEWHYANLMGFDAIEYERYIRRQRERYG